MKQQPVHTPQSLLFQIAPVTNLYQVPTTLVATILQVESNWNPNALGDYQTLNGLLRATSIGLFQLHLGGQADEALKDGHTFEELADPLLNTTYAMPSISRAWLQLGGWDGFDPFSMVWWQGFASISGHPGGVAGIDPANVHESLWLQDTYLKGLNMVQYSSLGEVGDFNQADQMQPGKSQFECGWFATFIFDSMAPVGEPPKLTTQQIIDQAEQDYANVYGGDNSIGNMMGMTDQQLYDLLHRIGRHYQTTDMNIDTIRAWLRLGYPVITGVYETSVNDLMLGGNPYPWTAGGTHVILITGPGSGDSILVRDPANCTNLYDPNSLRTGPRSYSASQLQFVSATAVVPYWLPQPPAGYNPLKDGSFMGVPTGWHDDGKTLAINGFTITGGERDFLLNFTPQWDKNDQPLENGADGLLVEESNKPLGYGWRRLYTQSQIEYTKDRWFFKGWLGQELKFVRSDRDSKANQLVTANASVTSLTTQVSTLQSQVDALKAQLAAQGTSGIPAPLQVAVDAAVVGLTPFRTVPPVTPLKGK